MNAQLLQFAEVCRRLVLSLSHFTQVSDSLCHGQPETCNRWQGLCLQKMEILRLLCYEHHCYASAFERVCSEWSRWTERCGKSVIFLTVRTMNASFILPRFSSGITDILEYFDIRSQYHESIELYPPFRVLHLSFPPPLPSSPPPSFPSHQIPQYNTPLSTYPDLADIS